jgi:hypothetical protein
MAQQARPGDSDRALGAAFPTHPKQGACASRSIFNLTEGRAGDGLAAIKVAAVVIAKPNLVWSPRNTSMTIFCRDFPIERVSDSVLAKNGWFCDLLRHWRPSGDAIGTYVVQEEEEHLRLAIRCGYLNFYRAGQSVAKVSFNRGGKLQAKIHNKYVYGIDGSGQRYVTLTSEGFPELRTGRLIPYEGPGQLQEWISKANNHVGHEKCFIDLVVSRNPNIIDLSRWGCPLIPQSQRSGALLGWIWLGSNLSAIVGALCFGKRNS